MSFVSSSLSSSFAPGRLGRQPIDESLAAHVNGCLYPFHTDYWNPTHNSSTFPSRKLKVTARGQFVTSAGAAADEWGYVYAAPSLASNDPSGGFSAGGNTAFDQFANATTFVNNSPYVFADFSVAEYQSRHNVIGLRVRNITPMNDRGGTLFSLRSPSDSNLTGAAFNDLIQRCNVTGDVTRCDTTGSKWNYAYWVPRDIDQTEYEPFSFCVNPSGGQMTNVICFIAQGPEGIPQTYEFEFVEFGEVISSAAYFPQHGCTSNDPHIHTLKCQQIIAKLHARPEVNQNEPSHALANFVTSAVLAGHRIADIVERGCDIASRAVNMGPSVMKVGKMLLKAVA